MRNCSRAYGTGDSLLQTSKPAFGFIGGITARIFANNTFQRFFRGRFFIHFLLAAGDVEHRIGRLGAIRKSADQLFLSIDCILEVAQRVIGITDPVVSTRCKTGTRIGLQEFIELGNSVLIPRTLE